MKALSQINKRSLVMYISLALTACFILVLSFIRESSHQTETRLGVAVVPSPLKPNQIPFVLVPKHTDYVLPNPGMLPTHPLYPLKMIRDRIRLLFTWDRYSRTATLLEYANKRIAAAEALASAGNLDEALTVATKAEIYLFQTVIDIPKVDMSRQSILYDHIKQATLKHEEIIERINKIAPDFGNHQAARLLQQLDVTRATIISQSGQPFGYPRPEDNTENEEMIIPASPSARPQNNPKFYPEPML